MMAAFKNLEIGCTDHPLCSPDLALFNTLLFPIFKRSLKKITFSNDLVMVAVEKQNFNNQTSELFWKG